MKKEFENLEVQDMGSFYEVRFIKKDGSIEIYPMIGEILNFGDIVAFTDGQGPNELTKQDWINLYLIKNKK